MIFDASEPGITDLASISIPGISEMLVIGKSPSALKFSSNIKKITRYQTIYHVSDIESAAELLKSIKFSIIIIDNDSNFNPISCSRVVRLQNSSARIILISKSLDVSSIFDMKNKGIIHGHISVPCPDILAHTILVQEQSKFHINQTLHTMLTSPPEGTTFSRMLKSSRIKQRIRNNHKFDLLAISIVHATISKYNAVFDERFDLEPILFSSYFSAISIFSDKILNSTNNVESFEFEEVVVFIKSIEQVQYVFVFRNVVEENRKAIENLVVTLSQKLHISFADQITSQPAILHDSKIANLIHHYLPQHQKASHFFEAEKKSKVINIYEPNSTLAEIFDETERVYEVHYVDDENQLIDMLTEDNYDLIIINGFEKEFRKNKSLLNIVKDESPFTQSIAITEDINSVNITNILNVNELDYILHQNSAKEEFYGLFKRAIERSKSIQEGIVLSDLNRVYRIQDKSEFIKTMLRKNLDKFGESTVPVFNGLFIIRGEKKIYSHYVSEDRNAIEENEEIFLGFIESLMTFTDEIKNSPLVFSGIKYGDSNIIVQKIKRYNFIYFISNLDSTNYDIIQDVLQVKSNDIFRLMDHDINPLVLSDGLSQLIDEICYNISTKLSNLEF